MVFTLSSWRMGAVAGFVALLSLGMACHKSNTNPPSTAGTIEISGTVTYLRVPLLTDPNSGMPTGLEGDSTKFTKLPARGVMVRVYQQVESYDGSPYTAWVVQTSKVFQGSKLVQGTLKNAYSSATGTYSIRVDAGRKTFVEIVSVGKFFDATEGAETGGLKLFAEADGLSNPTLEPDRLLYVMRKGLDGSPQRDPLLPPGTMASANATVNFDIGLTDPWWLTPVKDMWNPDLLKAQSDSKRIQLEGPEYAMNPDNAGTGSRVLAILDSAYTFNQAYGVLGEYNQVPDFHYFYNCHVDQPQAKFSYMDYDRKTYPQRLPQSYNIASMSYQPFGYIQGGNQSDDAFDEGVLFSIFAKNNLVANIPSPLPILKSHKLGDYQDLQDLRPDLAVIEGLSPAMAASLLKSPYLADTTGQPGTGLNPLNPMRDIRDLTGIKRSVFSAPNLTSLSWEILLKANALSSPGTPGDWAKIDPSITTYFFSFNLYSSFDITSIYDRLYRLEYTDALKAIFYGTPSSFAVLKPILTPFNIPWPRPTPTTESNSPLLTFIPFWAQDPNSLVKQMPSLTLSMAYAQQQDGLFSNVTWGFDDPLNPTIAKGEVFTGMFSVTKDTIYDLSISTSPAIPASAKITVFIANPNTTGSPIFASGNTYSFGASSDTQHYQIPVGMSGVSRIAPAYHPVLVRLVSPVVQQPTDLTVTVNLVPLR